MKRHLRIQARSVSCSTSLENLELEALAAYTNHAEVPIYKRRLTTKLKIKRHLLIQARALPAQPLLEHLELEALAAYTNLAEVPISTPRLTTKLKNKRHLMIQARAFPAQPQNTSSWKHYLLTPTSQRFQSPRQQKSQPRKLIKRHLFDPGKKCFLLNLAR